MIIDTHKKKTRLVDFFFWSIEESSIQFENSFFFFITLTQRIFSKSKWCNRFD